MQQRLASSGYEVVGVDPSEGMLEVLRRRSPEIRAIHASGTALPFSDDSFDLVLTVAVMHHIADPHDVRQTLAEMVRVVRAGGRVLIWDHNPRNPYWGRLMARVPQDTGEERLIGEAEIVAGLRCAGAQILDASQLGLVPDFTPPGAHAGRGGVGAPVRADPVRATAGGPQRDPRDASLRLLTRSRGASSATISPSPSR